MIYRVGVELVSTQMVIYNLLSFVRDARTWLKSGSGYSHSVSQVIPRNGQVTCVKKKTGKCSGGLQTSIEGRDLGKEEWKAKAFLYITKGDHNIPSLNYLDFLLK